MAIFAGVSIGEKPNFTGRFFEWQRPFDFSTRYNNAGMSQFYMRFVRYTSTEKKDLYFPIYIGSLESNLMQMVLAKEKLTMFMKGQDADMDEIYAKFGVDYDLLSTLMTRETDDEGHLRIHWGEQKIA